MRPIFANVAVAALASTIVLILVGSIVRVSGHGLGCPDWPLCYGQPIPPFVLGAWVEFSHRLLGAIVSLLIVSIALMAWKWYRQERWILRPALGALGLLAIQVMLGGIHVLNELPPSVGWIHTGVAMAVAGAVAMVVAASHPALRALALALGQTVTGRLSFTAAIAGLATYVLLLTGSLVTRSGSSLACPAFPHCGLATIPPEFRYYVTIQMAHRHAAFLVALLMALLLWKLTRAAPALVGVRRFAVALLTLLALQFGLGMANIFLALPMWSRSLHLAVAATIWVTVVMLWVVATRDRAT
jgi:heme A synthase